MSAIFTGKEYLALWSKLFYLSVLVFFVEVVSVQSSFAPAPSADPLNEVDFEHYTYPDQRHVFQGEAWTLAMERTLAFFDQYVKTQ